jgi:hypothetical protein
VSESFAQNFVVQHRDLMFWAKDYLWIDFETQHEWVWVREDRRLININPRGHL